MEGARALFPMRRARAPALQAQGGPRGNPRRVEGMRQTRCSGARGRKRETKKKNLSVVFFSRALDEVTKIPFQPLFFYLLFFRAARAAAEGA
jgi:hypothetical protein